MRNTNFDSSNNAGDPDNSVDRQGPDLDYWGIEWLRNTSSWAFVKSSEID